ncbi:MAG TPA: 30S ribosomal protein S18 [Candidatus Woesebacteria bacterium]|nr:30S ribosomal protein S18 [Candidatus Woesebacteria bacterium]HPJ17192.1 30S ribosomal protein S18 [Candidatus Woesebacteria bacterium]
MPKDNRKNRRPVIKVERNCSFCAKKTEPRWEDYENFGDFLSARGRILGKTMNGVCNKHQKVLAKAIKQARHLALIPFTNKG